MWDVASRHDNVEGLIYGVGYVGAVVESLGGTDRTSVR